MPALWIVGAMLAALGSIASNMGVNIQKYSFLKNAKLDPELQRPYIKQPLWAVGIGLVIAGSLGDFAALALAAQSIVAPIGSITLVSNVLFAHYGLKEPLSKRDMIGTAFIVCGSTLSVAFGNHVEVTYTLEELKELYTQTGFIVYAIVLSAVCVVFYIIIKLLQPIKEEMVDKCQDYELAVAAETKDLAMIEALDLRIAELELKYERYEKIHPFTYCALSGCLGAQSILFGKMLAEMIGSSIRGDNQMIYPLTYVFLLCMFFCVFTQLHFLALGLRFFDALYVVPVFQCFFISVSTLGGAAYFGEFGAFEVLQIAFFPIGIFLTLSGVYILSSRDMKKNAARTGGNGELSEVAVSSVDNEIPLSERASGLRPSDAIHLEGDSAANHLDEPSRNRRDDDVRPFAAGLTSSDDPEEVEVMSGGASQKYVTPSSGAQPISPNRRPPPPPDREYPVSASMPAQMFMHTHNANGAYNGSSGQYPAPPLPPGSSRPSTAGEKRMSRFAQRQSRAASRAAEPGQSGGMFASAVAAHAEWRANGSASGQWPAAGSSGQFPARNRTRSTWSAADHSRGSVFHAGLAVLGATGPPDEL